ncbi:hypothetical protein H4Q26_012443 [Puccinia striiformis f. sp. tritici PST-130]|nr:hypothetical protein H4Q26_012443 [Puccinia striiformis f. sp. tritici PST-130]
MSSSSLDLGKTILAKLEQSQLPKKKPNPASSSKRTGPSGTESTENKDTKTTPAPAKVIKSKLRKDKRLEQRRQKQQKQTTEQPEAACSSSNQIRQEKQTGKLTKTKSSGDVPSKDQNKPTKSSTKSNQESDEEEIKTVEDSEEEIDDRDILLAEIKTLGGTEEDLDLFEGLSSQKRVIQEDDHGADPELVNDLKSFMKGLDFEAALMQSSKHDKEISPEPNSVLDPPSSTTALDHAPTQSSSSSVAAPHQKRSCPNHWDQFWLEKLANNNNILTNRSMASTYSDQIPIKRRITTNSNNQPPYEVTIEKRPLLQPSVDLRHASSPSPSAHWSHQRNAVYPINQHPARQIPRYEPPLIIDDLRELIPLLIYTILSLATRLYRIGRVNTVVWDEAHFGKFGGHYLNQTFYFDVHPPLAKMMVGLAGVLSGFDGTYDFPSGDVYPKHVPFISMRILLALPGVALVPIAWATALELGFSEYTRHIVTIMVLSDIALTAISRFILLDSTLLFFTFTTVYCLACFNNQRRYPFDFEWWFWLSMTGLSIGCVTSVKWIGLFVTALVGAHTLDELWEKFGDLRMPIRTYIQHWIARILCLVILPVLVYMSFFKIHFLILNRSGPGDAQMSSLFQANLYGNDFARSPLEIAIGSKVTIKNMGFGGGLLHSHVQSYPTGSQQQQVTCYHYRDANNEWTVTPLLHEPTYDETQPMKFLKHGSVVRLVHTFTGRNLHTHSIPAPITTLNHEVACYGNATVDDSNSYWMIEVVDDTIRGRRKNFENIHILSTRFRIRNLNLGCYLRAANAILPQWGFKQVEVSCDKQMIQAINILIGTLKGTLILVVIPEGDMKLMKSPFLRDFWHLNVAMMTANNALIPDPDKEDVTASTPFEWPFLYTGMRMNAWIDQGIKFYLIGNPLTWWLCSFTLWFSILMFGLMVDHFIFKAKTSKLISLTKLNKLVICLTLCLSILFTGIWFKDCAWGIIGPVHLYKYRQWRKSWSIYEDHTTG